MTAVDRILGTGDRLRRLFLVPVARAAPWLVVSRDARVGFGGTVLVALALGAAGFVPAWMLGIGPLVWGVPHVLADIRYLVVRPGLHRRRRISAALVAAIALSFGFGIRGAIAGGAAAVLLSRASVARKLAVVGVSGVLFAIAAACAETADVVFAHCHNLVAIGFFWAFRRRASRLFLLPVVAFVCGAVLLLAGTFDGLALATRIGTLDLELARETLAPGLDTTAATRLVLLFAFAQSVHYIVWIALIPAEARSRETPPSLRQAARAIVSDLGSLVVLAGLVTTTVLGVWAFRDLASARSMYLAVASFHGWLEVGVAMLFLAEGRRQ